MSATDNPSRCGDCRHASARGIPFSRWCELDCRYEPINPPAPVAFPTIGKRFATIPRKPQSSNGWADEDIARTETACRAAYDAEDPQSRGAYGAFRSGYFAAVTGARPWLKT